MNKVRVGVLGAAGIAYGAHLPGYERLADKVEIVAACDVNQEKLNRAAEKFRIPHLFTDYRQMLEMNELDAVSVCTPNFLHAPMTIDALKAGKHVLCEKPMALNADDAKLMVRTAENSGRILMMALNNRFLDESVQLKKMIESGRLGEIYAARTGWLRRRGVPYWGKWFMDKSKSGGGPLIDLGVHMLDLTWWLMGRPDPVSVQGTVYHEIEDYRLDGSPDAKTDLYDVEDSSFSLIRFKNGASIMLSVSWCLNTEGEGRFLDLYGSQGGAKWSPLTVYTQENDRLVDLKITTQEVKGHFAEIEHFIDCIQNEKQTISPADDQVKIMQILDAIYKSAETGREVRLD